jgi:hypothetical protein
MVGIVFQFFVEDKKGHGKKKEADEGTEAMDNSFLHHAP